MSSQKDTLMHEMVLDRTIHIGDDIELHLYSIDPVKVNIGVQAPQNISIDREEIRIAKQPQAVAKKCKTHPRLERLGNTTIKQRKKRITSHYKLIAQFDIPEYRVLKGAMLIFYRSGDSYYVMSQDGSKVDWLTWSAEALCAEIQNGAWSMASEEDLLRRQVGQLEVIPKSQSRLNSPFLHN